MTTITTPLHSDITPVSQKSPAANGLAIVRVTIGAMFVSVFFENWAKGLYSPAGYAGLINYYIKQSHSPAAWKAVMGMAASHAAMAAPLQAVDRDLARSSAAHRSAYAPGRFCGIPLPRKPLGLRVGNVMDLGATGSGARIAWPRSWTRRSCLGYRCVAGTAAASVPVVVIEELTCECRSSFLPITKRRPLAVCLPTCLPISSLK